MSDSPETYEKEPGKREWTSFWALTGMQTANAFNDNFAKFILIPLGVVLATQGLAFAGVEYVLGLLMVIPFILFAPTAGWIGDRFPKNQVIRWSSWLQFFVLMLMSAALAAHSLPLVLVAFFFLASQSAILSPAKMGIVKELVGSSRLGFANGVMEGTVILAILLGQIIGGIWFDKWGLQLGRGPWDAALVPLLWVLIGGALSLVLSYLIQRTRSLNDEKFSSAIMWRHFGDLKRLKSHAALWRCTLGIAFFWGFGGFLQLLVIQIAAETTGGEQGMGVETALLWLPVVVGIVMGSLLASWVCRRSNELGLVVIGGGLMALAMLFLALTPVSSSLVKFFLMLAGCGGALFLVPLNAYLQDHSPQDERALVIAASNLCINIAGVIAVALQFTLKSAGLPAWTQYLFVAVLCGWATIHIMRLLPKDFVRLIAKGFFRSIYKIKTLGEEKIPREGGVLLVSNHLTYVDAIILSVACPRPIRFLMFADCFDRKWLGKCVRFFDTVPISPTRAKDGIRVASQALEAGAVVCIFPEGQLSRTGGLSELQRGYQMIARKSGSPILPAYMDGLWGSVFSFSGGDFLKKAPHTLRYGVSVAFGELLGPKDDLLRAFHDLSGQTVEDRELAFRKAKACEPRLLSDLPFGWNELKEMAWADDERGRQLRMNALQLSQVHLGSRKSRLLVECDSECESSAVLALLWPMAIHAPVAFIEKGTSDEKIQELINRERLDVIILRGARKRASFIKRLIEKGCTVWSFEENPQSDGLIHAGLVREGRILTYALPHPDYDTTTQLAQPGWKEGSLGKLLPGFQFENGRISGPSIPAPFPLEGAEMDTESFIFTTRNLLSS